jgi:UDP-galactopyranose mutase
LHDVSFVGRLATYKYYNMDQVVAQSLTLFKKLAAAHAASLAGGAEASSADAVEA